MMIMICKEKGLLAYDDLVEKYLDVPYKELQLEIF